MESVNFVFWKTFLHEVRGGKQTSPFTVCPNYEKSTSQVPPTLSRSSSDVLGNSIPLRLDRPFYNLQYLELASIKLSSLPADFASRVPNVRILNLSYNSLKDVTPLRGMVLLKRLFLIGNRLSSLSDGTTETLLSLTELQVLDLRYPPTQPVLPRLC